jgi:SAM-dependent methyltransferase
MGLRQRLLDHLDHRLCAAGLLRAADWRDVLAAPDPRLYAGRLSRDLRQYDGFWGMAPDFPSRRNLAHDVTQPMPLPDAVVAVYQSEDVFEHVAYDRQPHMFDEIFRVLRPGGLFRLSLPDYRFDAYADRSQRDAAGAIVYDPGGGGRYIDGRVTGGGHLWFPTLESVRAIFAASRFATEGAVRYLHYTAADGGLVLDPIDYSLGHVQRTPDHDPRAQAPRRPMSIVVDAVKA